MVRNLAELLPDYEIMLLIKHTSIDLMTHWFILSTQERGVKIHLWERVFVNNVLSIVFK